jgi:hypothetical protein
MSPCRDRSRHCCPVTRYKPSLLSAGAARKTASCCGWRAERFDVVVTADRNLEHQQNLTTLPIAVVVLIASTNRLESLAPLAPELLELLKVMPSRRLVQIGV